jgi:Gamma-glutamyl cyclotransferase, AIG2-like
MFEPVWRSVCAGTYQTAKGQIQGFNRYCVANQTYPAVIPEPGGCVAGLIYLDVSPEDLARLDLFEGAEYRRISTTIDGLSVVLFEFLPLQQVVKVPWDVDAFAAHGLPKFLSTQVHSFLTNGSR